MFFISTFYGSLFCGSAVNILDDLIAHIRMLSANQGEWTLRCCGHFQGQPKIGSSGPEVFIYSVCFSGSRVL